MALCRHFSRLSCRAFCSKADVVKVPQHAPPWSELLRAVEEHLAEPGKVFLPSLREVFSQEMNLQQKLIENAEKVAAAKDKLIEKAEKLIEKAEKLTEKAEKVAEAKDMVIASLQERLREQRETVITSLQERVQDLKEQQVKDTLEILKLSGRNDTRGLFERMQEVLESRLNTTKKLRGTGLWEAILKSDPTLAKCVQDHTGVQVVDVAKQALHCYTIYSILSQHVHAGKELAALQASTGDTILFHRVEMTPEQVCIFRCIGVAAGFDIAEDPSSRLADRALLSKRTRRWLDTIKGEREGCQASSGTNAANGDD